MTEWFLSLFWSLFGPRILYFGPGILISLRGSFIRNDRMIFVSFLVPFWSRNPIFWPRNHIFWTRNLNFLEGKLYKEWQSDFLVPFWSWNPIFWSRNPIFWTRSRTFLDGKLYKEWQRDFCIFLGPFLVPFSYILVPKSYSLDPESYFPWWKAL